MKALAKFASGPGNVGIIDVAEPVLGPSDALVEVHAAGVCGTDLHIEADEFPTSPPVTMGHEVSGVVVEVAANADRRWLGQRVAVETFYSTCQVCQWCRDGHPNLCPGRRSIGVHVDGGFAAHVRVPVKNLHAVPQWVDPHAAALAEPLACVSNCLLDPAAVQPGDSVLVVGPGPMGLLAAQVARTLGGSVTLAGQSRDAERLAVGADLEFHVIDDLPDPESADVVIECSGSAAGAVTCLRAARRGGRYVQIGVFGKEVTVPLDRLFYAELIATSGFASTPRSWRRAMALIANNSVDLRPLVTRAEPLAAWPVVFTDLKQARGIKIVFDPRISDTPSSGATIP